MSQTPILQKVAIVASAVSLGGVMIAGFFAHKEITVITLAVTHLFLLLAKYAYVQDELTKLPDNNKPNPKPKSTIWGSSKNEELDDSRSFWDKTLDWFFTDDWSIFALFILLFSMAILFHLSSSVKKFD